MILLRGVLMVKCPNCGKENRDGLKVCLHCGSNLPVPHESNESPKSHEFHESPKEVKKEVLTEKPKKSGHRLRNLIILLVLIFLFLIGIGGFASLSSNGNSIGQGLSDHSYYIDFDGLFRIYFNENMTFVGHSDNSICERYWFLMGDADTDEPKLTIFYWLADKSYDLRLLEEYTEPEIDGNLWIYTNNNKKNDISQNDDYLVVINNGEEVVGFMGADLDTLKDYANSVKFE